MNPNTLRDDLRNGTGDFLTRRRRVVGLSLVAAGAMGYITLYQMGIVDHLKEPPLSVFDADRIDASDEAYSRFATPDGALGLGSYAATVALAAMGGGDRAFSHPWIPLLLAGKVTFDVSQGVRLTIDQWTKYRAFCFWCLLTASATFLSAPLIIPEVRAALRQVGGVDSAQEPS